MAVINAKEYAEEDKNFHNHLGSAFPGSTLYLSVKEIYYCTNCETLWMYELKCFNCGTELEKGDNG